MEKKLDPLLHNELRLAIMSLLVSLKSCDYPFIKEKTGATSGNISIQAQKLRDAGYLSIEKGFKDNYPQTIYKIQPAGLKAFEEYVNSLKDYLEGNL